MKNTGALKHSRFVFVISLCFCLAASCSADTENAAEKQRIQTIERGRALVRSGQYHQARQVLAGHVWIMQDELLRLIENAKDEKQNAVALELYKIQFGFFPLGAQGDAQIENLRDKWVQRVLDYAYLLSTSSLASDRRLAAQERGAVSLYRAFIKARDPKTARRGWALLEQMANMYPLSVFTLSAMDYSGRINWWCGDFAEEGGRGLRFFNAALKSLEKAGAPARHRITVLHKIALEADDVMNRTLERQRIAYNAQRQIERLADLSSEKSQALLEAAKISGEFREKDAAARSRALYYEVLEKYPNSEAAPQARQAIIESWLSARESVSALHAVRQFETSASQSEIAELMLLVAMRLNGRYGDPEAQPILEDIIKRFPRQGAAAQANVWLAGIYEKQGNEAQMLALYEKVAALDKTDIDGGVAYMSEAQSTAIARLGSHAMKREK